MCVCVMTAVTLCVCVMTAVCQASRDRAVAMTSASTTASTKATAPDTLARQSARTFGCLPVIKLN